MTKTDQISVENVHMLQLLEKFQVMLRAFSFVLHVPGLGSQLRMIFLKLLILDEQLIVGFVEVGRVFLR